METYADEVELSEKPQPVAGPSRRKQPKSKALLALAGGFAVVAALGTGLWLHYRYRVSTDDAQVDAHIAPVAPKISGNVVEILVDDNQRVKAGQIFVRIDPRDYQA
jgi:membrane fusion protein (multidrug efflux system)